ncbi:GNAT family N-acetyltransferase [Kribbella qitaiheensis]|uniref:GNAT family N-acetyltransferase n=1 Tax=Kribbella qitaiheensis TaxID=1544730 RepID=A0A7G6X920_9ACTN|nr:GNAT family N-acetyltransferase [Kribbella qitaiheensis]
MRTAAVLPDGYTVRPAEPRDAESLFGLLSAYNTAVVGFADCTLEAVADSLVEPGIDHVTDSWLVLTGDGVLAGYASAFGKGDLQVIGIEVTSQDPSVAAWLFDRAMCRAREMGRDRGHPEITVDLWSYRADESLAALLADNDITACTTYHRMRLDHTGPVAAPNPPAGVVVRRGAHDDATRWAAHEVIIDSFRGQFGFVPRPHDEWVEALEASSMFAWSQLILLEIDGRAVAVRTCFDDFIESDNCGYVGMLGVVEEFRGRGLAKFLLQDSFAADAAAGRTGTILNVDTNNPTPALGLYTSVGMTPTLVLNGWRRVVPTEPAS